MATSMVMASPVSPAHSNTLLFASSHSYRSSRASIRSVSSSLIISCPITKQIHLSSWIPQLGSSLFSPWSGLKHLGISVTSKSVNLSEKKRRKCKGSVFYASLFGVGAPEALVIGVVALLVFGPKGLAEDVSREFKSTLEREIGLDDISTSTQNPYGFNRTDTASTPPSVTSTEESENVAGPNGASSPKREYTTEEYLKMTEEQLKASSARQQVDHPKEKASQNLKLRLRIQ